jgi:hypothetical protein
MAHVIAKYPGARTQTYTTYLAHQADAEAIAAVLLARQRREYTATVTYARTRRHRRGDASEIRHGERQTLYDPTPSRFMRIRRRRN